MPQKEKDNQGPHIEIIGHIYTDFATKFGIPRQSGLVDELLGKIVFLPAYRSADAFRGIEDYSHLWLLWHFSQNSREGQTPSLTVRPPRLGGNMRMGVFATRSPFRPSPIGLSSVRLDHVEWDTPEGTVLYVRGADLASGTPILDIKPYLPFTDAHPSAKGGFSDQTKAYALKVVCSEDLLLPLSPELRKGLLKLLSGDPRPAYHDDGERVYGFTFASHEVTFRVKDDTLYVENILPCDKI